MKGNFMSIKTKFGKLKTYTEEQIQKVLDLKTQGYLIKDIELQTGVKKASIKKICNKLGIKLTEEQKKLATLGRRWVGHSSITDGLKSCSRCKQNLPIETFHKDRNRNSGLTANCKECSKKIYEKNREKISKHGKELRLKYPEKKAEKDRKYYETNKEKIVAKSVRWAAENPEKIKQYRKDARQRDPAKYRIKHSFYRARKAQATPKWLTKEQKKQIEQIYREAPKGYHVDHIVPIGGHNVCGLHVPSNLKGVDFKHIGPCHQYKRKLETMEEDKTLNRPFGCGLEEIQIIRTTTSTREIQDFIARYEWLGNMGRLTNPEFYLARHKITQDLAGVVIIADPNMPFGWAKAGIEGTIHRGATTSWAPKNLGSKLIMYACRESVKNSNRRVFSAYSDPDAGEIGTIYQACNFKYLGNRFGAKAKYEDENGKLWTNRDFSSTSFYKKIIKELGLKWPDEWTKPNGYKDISKIPEPIRKLVRNKAAEIKKTLVPIASTPKGKYLLIIGRDKREERLLKAKYCLNITEFHYLKRDETEEENQEIG
jgi:hypothetical protein